MSDQLPADIATRQKNYRKPRRPTKLRPGPAKADEMAARLAAGLHLYHPGDPEMDGEGVVAVPTRSSNNKLIVALRHAPERDYRAEGNPEPHWAEAGKVKRPGWQRNGHKRLGRAAPAEPFPGDPRKGAAWNERQALLRAFKARHGPGDHEGEDEDETGRQATYYRDAALRRGLES